MDKEPTIGEAVRTINTRLDSQDKVLSKIADQTTKTNGRVNSIENREWFARGVLAVVVLVLIPIFIFSIENYISIKSENNLSASVAQSLNR